MFDSATPWTVAHQAPLFMGFLKHMLTFIHQHCLQCRRPWFSSWVRKIPGEGIDYPLQYSWASLVAELVRILLQCRRPGFDPWIGKIPWRRERLPTPIFWCGEFHHGVAKSRT